MKNVFLEIFTWWSGQTLGTRIHTFLHGHLVGFDLDGNKYYVNKKNNKIRWVIYNGEIDASKINANWHDWIHYRTDEIPVTDKKEKSWYQKNYILYGLVMRACDQTSALTRGEKLMQTTK